MKACAECGKKLGMLNGYKHPVLGKKHLVCSPCWTQVDSSVQAWGEFVKEHSFRDGSSEGLKVDLAELNPFKDVLNVPSYSLVGKVVKN